MLSARNPIAIHRALICLKETCSQTKEHALLMSFKHILHAGQVMIRHPKGQNTIFSLFHSPMIISCLHVTFAKKKCGRGLAKDFTSLKDSHTSSYEENYLHQMHQMTDFDGERFMI